MSLIVEENLEFQEKLVKVNVKQAVGEQKDAIVADAMGDQGFDILA
jgi:hypothetical protein